MRTGPQNRLGRRDAGEQALIALFRQCGWLVWQGGPCDALLGGHGVIYVCEFKDGTKPPSKRKLTDAEAKFFQEWHGYPVVIIESEADVLELVNGAVPR